MAPGVQDRAVRWSCSVCVRDWAEPAQTVLQGGSRAASGDTALLPGCSPPVSLPPLPPFLHPDLWPGLPMGQASWKAEDADGVPEATEPGPGGGRVGAQGRPGTRASTSKGIAPFCKREGRVLCWASGSRSPGLSLWAFGRSEVREPGFLRRPNRRWDASLHFLRFSFAVPGLTWLPLPALQ